MIINVVDYPIIGKADLEKVGYEVPILGIKMVHDERLWELTETPEQKERRKNLAQYKAGELHG